MSIRLFYDRWQQYNRRLVEGVAMLTDEQLALRAAPEHWPVWAIVGHVAGVRVYWLCTVLGEPGADTTPWPDRSMYGWEDELDRPKTAAELKSALESTYAVIDGVLDRWTPDMLDVQFERMYAGIRQLHSRSSVLQRLLSHEAYHVGEISLALGANGIEPPYIWASYA
jgi:uncharacterized damage-inducible protein DinB